MVRLVQESGWGEYGVVVMHPVWRLLYSKSLKVKLCDGTMKSLANVLQDEHKTLESAFDFLLKNHSQLVLDNCSNESSLTVLYRLLNPGHELPPIKTLEHFTLET